MTTTDVSPELVAAVVDALRTGRPVPATAGVIRLHDLADLAHAVRTLRGDRPQESIAARAGTTLHTVSSIETGRHRATVDSLIAVAGALGRDLALVPRNSDARSAVAIRPQGAENGGGVGRDTPGGAEAVSGRMREDA